MSGSSNLSSSARKQKAANEDLTIFEKLDTIPALLSVCTLPFIPTHLNDNATHINCSIP
jgi:hypothetical protein